MSYKENCKMISEMISKLEQKKQERNELESSCAKTSRKVVDYNPPVIKLTNQEYHKMVKKFNESEAYKAASTFVSEVKAHESRYDYYQTTLADAIVKLTTEAKRMTAGFEGEEKVYSELKRLLPDDWHFFQNIILNGSEHDILILSKKGLYSIEVKNHATIMSWDRLGRYTEYRPGRGLRPDVIKDAVDPYSQVQSHLKSLSNLLSSLKPVSITPSMFSADGMVTIANDATVKTDSYFLLPVYGISHTAHVIESQEARKPVLPEKVIKYLYNAIVSNAQPARSYDFFDLTEIEKTLNEQFTKFMELHSKYDTVEIETQNLAKELKSYKRMFESCAVHHASFKSFVDDEATFAKHPILSILLITPLPFFILGDLKIRLISFTCASFAALCFYFFAFCKYLPYRIDRKKHGKLGELIGNVNFK